MSFIQIPNLPAVIGLAGDELFEGVQAGSSVKISLNQIIAATRTGLPTTLPIPVILGGTGAVTLTGYVKGSGTAPFTASTTIPNSDITGLGTMSTQDANAVAITGGSIAGIADLAVADGGTGQGAALTQYGLIYGSSATAMASTAAGTAAQVLHGNASGAPTWSAVALTTDVSGVLPLANGGTGINAVSTAAVYAALLGYTSTATATGTTVLTDTSTQYQLFTGTLGQTITLPVTSTLTTGWTFHIVNNSTGNLTVNASSGALVCTVIPNTTVMVTCISTAVTDATAWEFGFTDFGSVTGTGAVVLGTGPTITNGVLNGTVGASTPSTGAFTTVTASTSVLSSGTGGVGYSTGAGVAVTQLTSRTTAAPTTGVRKSGAVTLFTATAVVGTYFSFTVPNTGIAVTDTVVLSVRGATNTYVAFVSAITAATSFQITMASVAGTASDTPIVNFTIIKGVSA
jgi:hypothetical protein